MRKFIIFIGAMLLFRAALADAGFPYQSQVKISRKSASGELGNAAKKEIEIIYKESIEKCAANPGASDFIVVTDVAPSDAGDFSNASNELLSIKDYISTLGFPRNMIFADVIRKKEGVQAISPNVVIELSCRRKAE